MELEVSSKDLGNLPMVVMLGGTLNVFLTAQELVLVKIVTGQLQVVIEAMKVLV